MRQITAEALREHRIPHLIVGCPLGIAACEGSVQGEDIFELPVAADVIEVRVRVEDHYRQVGERRYDRAHVADT